MKQTIRLSEQDLKQIIRESIMEMIPEQHPQPKFKQGDMVAVNYNAADTGFGPDGQPAVVANIEWCEPENCWVYFCIHPRLPRRGWFHEQDLEPLNRNLNEVVEKVVKKVTESFNYDDNVEDYSESISFEAMNQIFNELGISIVGYRDVENRNTGETGIRYELETPEGFNANILEQKLKEAANDPDGVFVSIGQHRYAPEITRCSVVVVNR